MTNIYRVEFRPKAAKAFRKLDFALQKQLAKKIEQRRQAPAVPSDRLRDMPNCYKIKLRSSGLRAIYLIQNQKLVLLVLAIEKRERKEAYKLAAAELRKFHEQS